MNPVIPVRAFDDNYIWLIQDAERRRAAIVDPGDAEPVLAHLHASGQEPVAILVTHHHYDHTGGIGDLLKRFSVPVYGPDDARIPGVSQVVNDGDRIVLPELDLTLAALAVPGHTLSHVAYHGEGMLFCGDTLFTCGCGRLFEGTAAQMYHSLERIAALPDDTLVYCAHEYTLANLRFARIVESASVPLREREHAALQLRAKDRPTVPSSLGLERCTNPFLRSREDTVVSAAEAFAGKRLRDPVAVFAAVRHWKDTLD